MKNKTVQEIYTLKEEEFHFSGSAPYYCDTLTYSERDVNVFPHYHTTLEILILNNISGVAMVNGHEFEMADHEVIVLPPNSIHSFRIPKSEGTIQIIQISLQALKQVIDIESIFAKDHLSLQKLPIKSPLYSSLINLSSELYANKDASYLQQVSLIFKIFTELSKAQQTEQPIALDQRVLEVIEWTSANFCSKVALQDIADATKMSRYHFCRWFKKVSGINYNDFLNQVRLDHAKMLLRENRPVAEVCQLSGFETPSYFSQIFKKYFGITAVKYRQQNKA